MVLQLYLMGDPDGVSGVGMGDNGRPMVSNAGYLYLPTSMITLKKISKE